VYQRKDYTKKIEAMGSKDSGKVAVETGWVLWLNPSGEPYQQKG